MFPLPPGTQIVLLTNVVVFVIDMYLGGQLKNVFGLWPVDSGGFWIWQLLTYGFLHDQTNFIHIGFNMLAVATFGSNVERVWGRNRFLTYYLTCVLAAGVTQLLFDYATDSGGYTVGASGGVFGLMLAYAILFPHGKVMLILLPIPLPAPLFVALYGVAELMFGVTGAQPGVAHFAHLGGMLGGWLLIKYGRGRRP
jgi:membrane associated rhomboid family serine protease